MADAGGAADGDGGAGGSLFARLGGREALARVVDAFYDRIERDPELRPVFPADLGPGRERQRAFLEQWLGGEPRYSRRYGAPALRRRHLPFAITERGAARWLGHFAEALAECGAEPDVAREIVGGLRPVALRMVNRAGVAGPDGGALRDPPRA